MSAIRKEFLNDEGDARADVLCPDAGEDYALVIGVNDYPQLRPLRGAIADARAFAAWLVDAEGGALRTENVRTVVSTTDPLGPIGHEINDALEDILQRAGRSGGRRFYFYFSGHGCVGDRANDLALCLANWSTLRRRAALSSDAWLDVIVRSGVFAEVAFFLDCCRVWATRAVGLPPHVDFAKPVERKRGTRVFLAYATEFQRAAVEVDTGTSEQRENRGIFTKVLMDGLRGVVNAPDESITAASLKKYVEKATAQKARTLGFYQRAEVLNGFDEESSFGINRRSSQVSIASDRPVSSGARRVGSSSGVQTLPAPLSELAAEEASSVLWLASYVRFQASGQFDIRRPAVEEPRATSRFVLMVLPQETGGQPRSMQGYHAWAMARRDGITVDVDLAPKAPEHENMRVFSAKLDHGSYQLQTRGRKPRAIAVQLFPEWTTLMAFDHAQEPCFENVRVFLVKGTTGDLPNVGQLDYRVAYCLTLLNSCGQSFLGAAYAKRSATSNDNPMLGLLGAHMIARQKNPDASRIDSLAEQLESSIGACSDVDALRLRAALIRGGELPRVNRADPPMLREGLLAFVEASHRWPELIPSGSPLEYACIERLVDSPLSSWPVCPDRSNGDDWLTTTIDDEVTKRGGDTATLDAMTLARELGVPTQAVATRIEVTRECVTQKMIASTSQKLPANADIGRTEPVTGKAPKIPGYQLERVIGKGGMGRVYLAKREATGESVAIKVMLPEGAVPRDARQRFLREIQHLEALHHERIIGLLDQGEARRSFYFVTPYYERGNIAQWVQYRGLPNLEDAVRVILDVLEGLAFAHKLRYVHRDIKPQNILLDGSGRAIVADFGLAKCFEEAALWDITKSGTTQGSVAFMPREQAINFKRVRPSTDVWAVAAVLYWLLCGVIPRDTSASGNSFFAVLHSRVVPIRERLSTLPMALSELIDAALSDDPGLRPPDAEVFRARLENAMGGILTSTR